MGREGFDQDCDGPPAGWTAEAIADLVASLRASGMDGLDVLANLMGTVGLEGAMVAWPSVLAGPAWPGDRFMAFLDAVADLGPGTANQWLNEALVDGKVLPWRDVLTRADGMHFVGCGWLRSLPTSLSVQGVLALQDCPAIRRLPNHLSVRDDLSIQGCGMLENVSDILGVGDCVYVRGCASLVRLAGSLDVSAHLSVLECPSLVEVARSVQCGGGLGLTDCPSLVELPSDLAIKCNLVLDGCAAFRQLPAGLSVGRELHILRCPGWDRRIPSDARIAWGVKTDLAFRRGREAR